ncbi:hypothetical protein KA005_38410 [bacterium]|nr:hypothetical protein [bacterium]
MRKDNAAILFPWFFCTLLITAIGLISGKPVTGFVAGFFIGLILTIITLLIAGDKNDLEFLDKWIDYTAYEEVDSFLKVPFYTLGLWVEFIVIVGAGFLFITVIIGGIIGLISLIVYAIKSGY